MISSLHYYGHITADRNDSNCKFDVKSLYTDISLHLKIWWIIKFIEENDMNVGLSASELEKLIFMWTVKGRCLFQGQEDQQVDVVAMSSSLWPILGDIFMATLEL